ncbi:MAG: hypothetical protein JW827_05865 [Spirochaetes bacterium]|nr:hypothetical protein [Spirochaetota bacterium]
MKGKAVLIFIFFFCFSTVSFAFDYITNKNFIAYTPIPQPAKEVAVTDPDFNTTFYRVSDANLDGVGDRMAMVVYSRWSPLSSGQDYLYLQRAVGNPDALIYSAQDHSLIKILPEYITIDGVPNQFFISMESAEIRWDYTGDHPHRFYYVSGMKFYQYDVLSDTAHLIHDFSNEFPTAVKIHNDVEGDSSSDSRYWVWMVKGPYNGSHFPLLAIITYDKETDQILGVMDLAKYQANGGHYSSLPTPNMVDISPSGRKVVCLWGRCWGDAAYGERYLDIGTVFDGPHAWDLDFTGPVKVSIDETHSGWAWGYDGSELFVSQNNRQDWIEARNIDTGEIIQILQHGDLGWGNGFHFARMPQSKPGWVLMSTYKSGANSDWGDNQLLMLEIKPAAENPKVWRLGHTHNNYDEYYAEGFAAMSQYGDKLWWGAKWPGQNNIEAYEMVLPPTWWEDLSGGLVPALYSPVDITINTNRPSFYWSDESDRGATKYWIQLSESSDFSSVIINNTNIVVTNFSASIILSDNTYYWRVQAMASNTWRGWSAIRQFNINTGSIPPDSAPVIFYSDLENGPSTGGEDNKGAFVTIFGKNFGPSRGSSYITVGGGQVDNYRVWTDTKVSFQLGNAASSGDIIIFTSQGNSNPVPFTIRSCDIYFVATNGNDGGDGSFPNPWRHLSHARSVMSGGDILYIKGGTWTTAGENSSGKLFYVSGSYPWGGNGSDGNPHCLVGYPGEEIILQANSDGESIINYVGSDDQCAINSHIVFANFTVDCNQYESGIGWRGRRNDASPTYRVRDIRFVNIEVKDYLNTGHMGGTALIEFGADGPLDDVKVLGCKVHDMDSSSRLDHGIYVAAGGNNYEIAWNTVHNIKRVVSAGGDGNAGFGIQTYRGSSSHYADLNNLKLHDNLVYECPSRGGINLSDYTKDSQIYNNIVYNCGYDGNEEGYGLRISVDAGAPGTGTHYIYNNTFYNCGEANSANDSSIIGFFTGDAQHVYLRNNIFHAVANQNYAYNALDPALYTTSDNLWYGNGNAPSWASGQINSDPQLEDINNYNFHLASDSPCRDSGYDTTSMVPRDKDGVTRPQNTLVDIGAYEYAGSSTPVLTAPNLISPLHDIWTNHNTPVFDWSDVTGAEQYNIQIASDPGFTALQINATNTVSDFIPSVPLNDGTNYWKVRAYSTSVGFGPFSSTRIIKINTTVPSPPATPGWINAQAISDCQIDLIWQNIDNETAFTLFRNAVNQSNTANRVTGTSVNITNYSDTGLTPLTKYYYWIKAYNSAGHSGFSSVASNTTLVPSLTVTVFSDDFSTDKNWTGYGSPAQWERGPATSGGGEYGNEDPSLDHTLSADNYVAGNHIGGDYDNNIADTYWLTSPVIDCSYHDNVQLSFYRYLNVEQSAYDHVYLSVFNGSIWVVIWSNTGNITDSDWVYQSFDISAYADNNSLFQVRFGMGTTDVGWRYSGWNLDDIVISGNTSSSTLGAPVLLTPADDIWTNSGIIVFDWSDVMLAEKYNIQISDDNSFATLLLNVTNLDSNYTVSNSHGGTNYWRVRAFKESTGFGPFSEVRNLKIRKGSDTILSNQDISILPEGVSKSYPNPVSRIQIMTFEYGYNVNKIRDKIDLTIYNLSGHIVFSETYSPGEAKITWDLKTERNYKAACGLYLYRITVIYTDGSKITTDYNKFVIIK